MKINHKSSHLNSYLIAVGAILASFVVMFTIWLVFPTSVNRNEKVAEVKPATKLIVEPTPAPVQEPEISVPPDLAADYYIPPVDGGMAPVVYRIQTKENIVFLGIDDGAFKDQSVVDIMQKNHIKASMFLTKASIANNPDFFKQLIDQGSYAEDHTLSHDVNMVKDQSYEQQKAEICGMDDYELAHFGRRPTLFRPPGGAYSDITRQAAADCGMKAVVTWIAKANGGAMQYQVGNKLRAGDVVLMHFRPEFKDDMKAFVDAMKASGLHTALLEDAL
jgi:peptidoglycan/xylan/chitin deacetylase (PgdA/CDA1 family)